MAKNFQQYSFFYSNMRVNSLFTHSYHACWNSYTIWEKKPKVTFKFTKNFFLLFAAEQNKDKKIEKIEIKFQSFTTAGQQFVDLKIQYNIAVEYGATSTI